MQKKDKNAITTSLHSIFTLKNWIKLLDFGLTRFIQVFTTQSQSKQCKKKINHVEATGPYSVHTLYTTLS